MENNKFFYNGIQFFVSNYFILHFVNVDQCKGVL